MKIKKEYDKLVKEHGFFCALWLLFLLVAHKIAEHIAILYFKHFIPVNKKLILFKSSPDYSDNALALAEYMVANGYTERYHLFFDVEEPEKYKGKNTSISFFTSKNKNGTYKIKNIRLLYTANYLMSTHDMILNCYQGRKSQHFIRLWHGCGYKDRSSKDGHNRRNFDIALVPGPLFIDKKAYFWNVDEKYIIAKGYPRYDWLIKKDTNAQKMIQSYKINNESRIILWMPTYRVDKSGRYNDTKNLTNFPIIKEQEEWLKTDEQCKRNNIIILVKLHPFQKEYPIPFDKMSNIKEISNKDFDTSAVQMYSFIALTDALLTDYSSVAFDYLLVDKPLGFTLDDYKDYKDSRGFIFNNPLDYMPGHHLYTTNDLLQFVTSVRSQEDPYSEARKRVRNEAITPSSHYCKDLLDYLDIN